MNKKIFERCRNCIHFVPDRDRPGWGECKCPTFECIRNEKDETEEPFWDFEIHGSGFLVSENFGCIHFEPPDPPQKEYSASVKKKNNVYAVSFEPIAKEEA